MSRIAEHFLGDTPLLALMSRPMRPVALPSDMPDGIAEMFEALALKVAAAGFSKYSARAVMHRMRWEMNVEKGDREFRINNNWSAALSRWFMARHPELPEFFETRVQRAR